MKLLQPVKRPAAFTLIELLVVIAVVAVLVGMVIPPMHSRPKRTISACINNLKQIGVAAQIYAQDHAGLMPWQQFSIPSDTNSPRAAFVSNRPAWHYAQRISQHVYGTNLPGLNREYICPADSERKMVADKTKRLSGNDALSYFIGLNEASGSADVIAMGDRNLSPGQGQPLYSSPHGKPVSVDTNTTVWGTTKNNKFHEEVGCMLFTDGHVEYLKIFPSLLPRAVKAGGANANRFLFPQ